MSDQATIEAWRAVTRLLRETTQANMGEKLAQIHAATAGVGEAPKPKRKASSRGLDRQQRGGSNRGSSE